MTRQSMDEYAQSLSDPTLSHDDTGIRICALCERVRVSHIQPCHYCSADALKRKLKLIFFVGSLTLIAFVLAWILPAILPDETSETTAEPMHFPVPMTMTLDQPQTQEEWHQLYLANECRICPECCGLETD